MTLRPTRTWAWVGCGIVMAYAVSFGLVYLTLCGLIDLMDELWP